MSGDYWLGFATIPALALVVFLILAAIVGAEKYPGTASNCDLCKAAGYRHIWKRGYDYKARSRFSVWLADMIHLHFTARLPRHRDEWQAYFDAHPSFNDARRKRLSKTYGRVRPTPTDGDQP